MLAVVFKLKFNFERFLLFFVLCDVPKLAYAVALANWSFDLSFFSDGVNIFPELYYG
jgi:hypothetical protein